MGVRDRNRLRQRQKKRQRRVMLCLGAFMLLVTLAWQGLHAQPKYPWLQVPPDFYQPELLSPTAIKNDVILLPMPLGQEDTPLKDRLIAQIQTYPTSLRPHLFFYNLHDQRYVNINGDEPVAAASVIKLPILLEYFRQIEKGTLSHYSHLFFEDFEKADGSGTLQYQNPGQPLLAYDVARMMIQSSDNTCTNMLIYQFGGIDTLNRVFQSMGLKHTHINNWLPDLGGTNVISMRDMATVLYNLNQGTLLSNASQDTAFDILLKTHNRRLLPALLPPDTQVAHKTGDIGTSLGNSGLFILPNGQRYIVAIQVERPFNNYAAKEMIQQVSKVIYDDVQSKSAIATATGPKASF